MIMKLGSGKLPLLLMLDQLDQFLVINHLSRQKTQSLEILMETTASSLGSTSTFAIGAEATTISVFADG